RARPVLGESQVAVQVCPGNLNAARGDTHRDTQCSLLLSHPQALVNCLVFRVADVSDIPVDHVRVLDGRLPFSLRSALPFRSTYRTSPSSTSQTRVFASGPKTSRQYFGLF